MLSSRHALVHGAWRIAVLLCVVLIAFAPAAQAQSFTSGNYYWYVPEHEKYGPTQFHAEPRFDTARVRVTRAQRFRLIAGRRGWFLVEFDVAGKAYVPMRLLRLQAYDPTATDPWHEFKRASVFEEDPARIEARLKAPPPPAPRAAQSSTPSWKRYKDAWNLKPGARTPSHQAADTTDPTSVPTVPQPVEKKPRNKYPLLPPIMGPEPAREGADAANSSDAAAGTRP